MLGTTAEDWTAVLLAGLGRGRGVGVSGGRSGGDRRFGRGVRPAGLWSGKVARGHASVAASGVGQSGSLVLCASVACVAVGPAAAISPRGRAAVVLFYFRGYGLHAIFCSNVKMNAYVHCLL